MLSIMEVSTVSAEAARTSLSKKSPMPKKSLKNALLSPYETVRPICVDNKEIEEIMQRLLVHAKRESLWIPWSEYKLLSEEERRSMKQKRRAENVGKSLRKHLVFGINEIMSSIEKHSLSSAVVCEDLAPPFLMTFVLDLASIHHVPVLILPGLRKMLLMTMGFSSSCFGIKKSGASDDSMFYPLHQKIVESVKEFEIPGHQSVSQCPMIETLESEEQQSQILSVGETFSIHSKSVWPCMNPNRKSFWKLKKEKLRQNEKGKKTGNDSEEMENPSVSSKELMEFDNGIERCLQVKASKIEKMVEYLNWKRQTSHPYLRTFLINGSKKRKSMLDPDQCPSKFSEKMMQKVDDNDEDMLEAVRGENSSSQAKKLEDFQYVIRNPGEKRIKRIHLFKPLKLANI